ncbi:MAG TPA: TIGR03084 family metal-binding protein [Micromonosporaceae bacterium]|jgi:uncharacterized protein (TIGR03084 family)|nr:TIGR03084 family metal-binding protein [Micromonosporaceae bacterium]
MATDSGASADLAAALVADLGAESDDLDAMLTPLDATHWRLLTPAIGWTIADQVSHLAYFDEAAHAAATDPDRFRRELAQLVADGIDLPDRIAVRYRGMPGDELLSWWRRARSTLLDTFAALDRSLRLPWYGPEMSVASSVTARIMETWAHGQDIADALGRIRPATNRLRHIAHLGVRTTGFAFAINGREPPTAPIRVELDAPDGGMWTWGPAGAGNVVRGPAVDFCLVVTQRRHRDDTRLTSVGPVANEWIGISQAFAGPPGPGRARGSSVPLGDDGAATA